ncbi:MAG: alpha/beta hydrolase domain-containing protein [Dehalococcoidia bacterium]
MTVTRFQILNRRPGGRAFGQAGPYERIDGVLHFAVDPDNAMNAGIADLELAPRDAAGRVHFQGDIRLLRPLTKQPGGKLYTSVVNRGRCGIVPFSFPPKGFRPVFDDSLVPGDGFLLERGYTVAFCAWQWDVIRRPGALGLAAPLAYEADGRAVATTVTVRFQPLTNRPSEHLAHWPAHPSYREDEHHQPYPVADLEQADAVLTVKDTSNGGATVIPRAAWRFARVTDDAETPDAEWVSLDGGFEAGRIYEVSYRTEECPVAGLGLLAIRDSASFLRFGSASEGNPCAGTIEHAFTHGVSQTGRFLREFVLNGCNVDETGRQVFDGIFIQIAGARRGDFNVRGAQPSAQYGAGPVFEPPFTYAPTSTCTETLLDEQRRRGGVPKIFEVNTANEYWRSDGINVHMDPATGKSLELPDDVRVYMMAGCQHGPGIPFITDRPPLTPEQRLGNPMSILNYTPLTRAAMANLESWVVDGTSPPASCVPSPEAGRAVSRESVLATVGQLPGAATPAPSLIGKSQVSKVDSDGNEVAGIRLPELQVPLATSAGWNVRHPENGGEGQMSDMVGSTIPFAVTEAQREADGDPRPSIEARYSGLDDYQSKVRAAARQLMGDGFLLAQDIEPVVANAGVLWRRIVGTGES